MKVNKVVANRKIYKNRRWVLKCDGKYMKSLVDSPTDNLFSAMTFSFKHPNFITQNKTYKAVEIIINEK